ncbi:MAG TPA: histidine kinase dimerization/phospho-acceptor domain-containing protein, partial [Nannocystaceae bacterium]|nr:histidine kinase dimerization/phospho-acceptor domain-containing protein [Nannocystaceae bacterium]
MVRARIQRILHVHGAGAASALDDELRDAGFEVTAATDVCNALRTLRAEGPDIAVVEAGHAALDAAEIVRIAASDEMPSPIKIVVTSASAGTADDRVQWLELGAHAVLAGGCDPDELLATVRMLSRTRAAELELRRRIERLNDADRRKDEFLAVLAHELRNPLNVMTTSLALLSDRPPRDAVEARALAAMQRQTDHLRYMVDDLLDVSKVQRGEVEVRRTPVDLVDLLVRTSKSVREIMTERKRQTLATELVEGP